MNELSLRAYEKGYNTYSDFLNLNEISELKKSDAFSNCELYGGYDNADRCVAGFGYEHDKSNYPIKCIKIAPVRQKFADELNHRDFLGSLMNLGINRSTLGDIVISDNTAYLSSPAFLINPMAIPDTGFLIFTPASINARVPAHTVAMEEEPFDSRISDTTRTTYG